MINTPIYGLKKPLSSDFYNVEDQNDNMDKLENMLSGKLTTIRLSKDSNDIFTEIQYKRADDTLFKKSVLSGGISPKYTTRTVTFYAVDGIAVVATQVYTLSYTDDDLISEVLA